LRTIHSDEVDYKAISYGVGNINDNDTKKAKATGAVIIGFHTSIDAAAKAMADREKIRIEMFDIIYEIVEVVRSIMSDFLDPEIKHTPLGKLKVLALFGGSGKSQIVGGKVIQGKVARGGMIDIMRGNMTMATGKLIQLQQGKKDVPEVAEGTECGIRYEGPTDNPLSVIRVGDVLDVYQEEKIKRQI